jgi:DNA-binding response OmpR family regulator
MPKTRAPKAATVLSVSKDKELLFLRGEILKSEGFHVINALSVEEAIGALSDSIDLLLVGHTLTLAEAVAVAKSAKDFSNGRIGVCVIRKTMLRLPLTESTIDEYIDSMAKPEELVACVREVLSRASSSPSS